MISNKFVGSKAFERGALGILMFAVIGNPFKATAYDGGNGTEGNPYLISTQAHFTEMAADSEDISTYDQDIHFKLMADLDFSGSTYTEALVTPHPSLSAFYGTFNGNGHVLRNITIHAGVSTDDYNYNFGVFATIKGTVKNLSVENFQITSDSSSTRLQSAGSICGTLSRGTISNCYASGSISAPTNSFIAGGLCGDVGTSGSAVVRRSRSSVSLVLGEGSGYMGGLMGIAYPYADVQECFASGSITIQSGPNEHGSIYSGGFCGRNWGTIENCYAAGAVTGTGYNLGFGGFCGKNDKDGTLTKCYSTGQVVGNYSPYPSGGFCGGTEVGNVTNCFWDTQTSGKLTSTSGTGKTTYYMQDGSTFALADWDLESIWYMDGYPHLLWENPSRQLNAFEQWMNDENVSDGQQSEEDTPAGDCVPNLLKYACGLPALQVCTTSNLMQVVDGEEAFSVRYYKSKTSEGVLLEPAWASSLTGEWKTTGVEDAWVSDAGDREERKASIPLGSGGFIRLRALLVSE